jgi:hypothetical protein
MRQHGYHGGFKHPVRSFVVGTTLLVLLFLGFVAGIELGSPPTGAATTTRLVQGTATEVTTVTTPASTKTVSVPKPGNAVIRYEQGGVRVLVIREKSGKRYVIRYVPTTGPSGGTVARPIATTIYSTLTETQLATVTATETTTATVTETTTVTAPPPTDTATPPGS